jgi:hypothetical protein
MPAQQGSDLCYFHDPAHRATLLEAKRKGGRSRKANVLPGDAPDPRLRTPSDVVRAIEITFNQVRKGQIDPKTGTCLAVLADKALKALQAEAIEELALKVAKVERMIRDGKTIPQIGFSRNDARATGEESRIGPASGIIVDESQSEGWIRHDHTRHTGQVELKPVAPEKTRIPVEDMPLELQRQLLNWMRQRKAEQEARHLPGPEVKEVVDAKQAIGSGKRAPGATDGASGEPGSESAG